MIPKTLSVVTTPGTPSTVSVQDERASCSDNSQRARSWSSWGSVPVTHTAPSVGTPAPRSIAVSLGSRSSMQAACPTAGTLGMAIRRAPANAAPPAAATSQERVIDTHPSRTDGRRADLCPGRDPSRSRITSLDSARSLGRVFRVREVRAIALALLVAIVAGAVGTAFDGQVARAQGSPLALPTDEQLGADAVLAVSDVPPTGPPEIDVYQAEQDALAVGRSMPAEDWQIPDLARALGYDPLAAFAFVRDRIGFDAYGGALRGARGTLAARAGNALDRALLLRAILDEMVVPSRLAFGTLDAATVQAVVARSFDPPVQPLSTPPATDRAGVEAIATRARRDRARVRTALGSRIDGMDADETPRALSDVHDHVWVEIEYGPGWLDLDTTMPDAQPGTALTDSSSTSLDLPESLSHQVRFQVVAETFDGTVLSEQVVLDQTLDAVAASRTDIFLTFHPELPALANGIQQALNGTSPWTPALSVGSEVFDGDPFPILAGEDLFGDPEGGPELTALRLEITTYSPDGVDQRHTRVLYDRVPPTARASGAVVAAIFPDHHPRSHPRPRRCHPPAHRLERWHQRQSPCLRPGVRRPVDGCVADRSRRGRRVRARRPAPADGCGQ